MVEVIQDDRKIKLLFIDKYRRKSCDILHEKQIFWEHYLFDRQSTLTASKNT